MIGEHSHVTFIRVPLDLGAGRRGVDMGPSAFRLADGVVSDLIGHGAGTWRIDGDTLVLTRRDNGGAESITRLPIHESSEETLVLGNDRWRKTGASTPNTTAAPTDNDED